MAAEPPDAETVAARGRLGRAVDLDGEKFPPGFVAALSRSDWHAESLGRQLAGELSAQEFSLFEVVADSVIKVDAASAVTFRRHRGKTRNVSGP